MQNKIPLVVFLAGILSKTSGYTYRFILIKEQKNWTEAQSYCRETYVDLATVQSDEDRATLQEAANAGNFASYAWIGLYLCSWYWLPYQTPVSYAKWDTNKPDLNTNMACVTLNKYGKWDDEDCMVQKYFFCQTDKLDKLTDKFKYTETSMNWFDAQMFCRTKYKKDLATISDDTENDFLADIIYNKHDENAWIGLSNNQSQWYWSDQTDLSWSSVQWLKNSRNPVFKGCVKAETNGLLIDDNCLTPLPFYCREDTKIQNVRLTVKSDGYLNASAVMKAIETKMKKIFLEDKIYSMTWSVQPNGMIFQQQIIQESKNNTQKTACEDIG